VTGRVLVVGYGNALRSDDGLGWHVAERLAVDPRFGGVEILQRHQLTPELALDVSAAAVVVFVDATTSLSSGEVSVERVERLEHAGDTWSHHVSPSGLVALSQQLYGRSAEVYVVSCGMQSDEMGERLSPVVEAAMPTVIDAVAELVTSPK
jgi:hydrogenase maturation protease